MTELNYETLGTAMGWFVIGYLSYLGYKYEKSRTKYNKKHKRLGLIKYTLYQIKDTFTMTR